MTDALPRSSRWVLRHASWLHGAGLAVAVLALAGSGLRLARPSVLVAAGVAALVLVALLALWSRWQRERLVREAPLPQYLKRKLRETYPHLSHKDAELAERGLRQFFLACLRSRRRFVAMPSRAADTLWHDFILHTQAYRDWCALVLGRFLHHTPAEVLGPRADRNDGLRRAWYWSCRDEAIDPRAPTRLPLLFALDGKLGIEGGFRYVPDCRHRDVHGSNTQCGSAFSDEGAASGDADGLGGSDSGGDSGGDGGDGGGD